MAALLRYRGETDIFLFYFFPNSVLFFLSSVFSIDIFLGSVLFHLKEFVLNVGHGININDGHLEDRRVDAFHNKSNILFISGANYRSNGGWSLIAHYANDHCHKLIIF